MFSEKQMLERGSLFYSQAMYVLQSELVNVRKC